MKIHTTNYTLTFIGLAADCTADQGEAPPLNEKAKSVARLQYELLHQHPYHYTSDEVLLRVYAMRQHLASSELEAARQAFFSKGQACFRSAPLTKR
ncbi:hypothetical protein B0I18_108103 [Taibaiella chishuiensis]|uniref:Uncharacterized protein n=1 Tax=Taibaiella chishuiensis TaxID=1434707 RepID=A0A2P8CZH7_9BACT|nr:hypothetical protein B0I18_108103 [Taibaiella chishuiensis]